jgi:transcriptional regulator with XRE-family HTH domain
MAIVSFGELVRDLRAARSWSLRDLGERISFSRGYVGRVEVGERFPERPFARLADEALAAHGALLAAWDAENDLRRQAARIGQILTASVTDSLRLIGSDERADVDDLQQRAAALSVAYLAAPPGPMLTSAVDLRSEIVGRLRSHDYKVHELRDLYRSFAVVQGILAYAALDLGHADGAATHAELGWRLAERNDDNELRTWARGTQSLISRFSGDFTGAQTFIEDGLRYPTPGTGRLRLLAGLAQCRANQGDSERANETHDLAAHERDSLRSTDSVPGLFEFSRAKQHYYVGSSLMWLPDHRDAERAARESALAIAMWEEEPPESRSLDDEALARIYRATAHVHLGDLDGAEAAVSPIFGLPEDRQISWIKKRLANLATELDIHAYAKSRAALELRDRLMSAARSAS